jgi:hypothetical protein
MSAFTQRINRYLKAIEDQVQFLLPTAVIAHAFDVNGDENLTIAINGRTHRVRGKPETAPASGLVDGLGLTQRVYVPDVLEAGISTSAGTDASAGIPVERAVIYTVVTSKGTRARLHEKAAVALTDMVEGDASVVLVFQPAYDGFGYLGNL